MTLYGKEGVKLYTENFGGMPTGNVEIPNRLSFDVEYYAKKLLAMTEAEVGHLYPADEKREQAHSLLLDTDSYVF